jgi:hypothetical protein
MSDFEKAFRQDNLLDAEDMGGGVFRYSVEYVGGHPLYTERKRCDLFLYQNDLFLKELNLARARISSIILTFIFMELSCLTIKTL